MIKHIKRIWNWLQESGANYRKETALKKLEKWPFPLPVNSEIAKKQVKKVTVPKATTRKTVAKKVVAKKTVKKKAK